MNFNTLKINIFLIFFLFSTVIFSQNWKSNSGKSDFDGNYRTSYVIGVGTKFPYKNPMLTINRFNEKEVLNLYVSKSGYFTKGTNTTLIWVFDSEPSNKYYSFPQSYSSDGSIVFLGTFKNPESDYSINKLEFIKKLKESTKVSLRISSDYSSNDITFSLSGSTKAIDYVIPMQTMNNLIEKERRFVKNQSVKLEMLLEYCNNVQLSNTSLMIIESKLKEDLGIGSVIDYSKDHNYRLLKIIPKSSTMFEEYGYVNIYYSSEDSQDKEIVGAWKVDMNSKLFVEYEELKKKKANELIKLKEKEKADKERELQLIRTVLEKYNNQRLIDLILVSILDKQRWSSNKWSLNDIANIESVFSDYSLGKFYTIDINIYLKDGEVIKKTKSIYELEISKKELKEMGGKIGIGF